MNSFGKVLINIVFCLLAGFILAFFAVWVTGTYWWPYDFIVIVNALLYWDFKRQKHPVSTKFVRTNFIFLNLIAVPIFMILWVFTNIGGVD